MTLVRALMGDQQVTVSPEYAASHKLTVLSGEPTEHADGTIREATRKDGRPIKPRTTVTDAAATKQAAKPSADTTKES